MKVERFFQRTARKTKDASAASVIVLSAERIPAVDKNHPRHTSNCKQIPLNNAAQVSAAIRKPVEILMYKIVIFISASHVMPSPVHIGSLCIRGAYKCVHVTRKFVYYACVYM